jgi:hypothetical protein
LDHPFGVSLKFVFFHHSRIGYDLEEILPHKRYFGNRKQAIDIAAGCSPAAPQLPSAVLTALEQ